MRLNIRVGLSGRSSITGCTVLDISNDIDRFLTSVIHSESICLDLMYVCHGAGPSTVLHQGQYGIERLQASASGSVRYANLMSTYTA